MLTNQNVQNVLLVMLPVMVMTVILAMMFAQLVHVIRAQMLANQNVQNVLLVMLPVSRLHGLWAQQWLAHTAVPIGMLTTSCTMRARHWCNAMRIVRNQMSAWAPHLVWLLEIILAIV
jgi:hypothetical protein